MCKGFERAKRILQERECFKHSPFAAFMLPQLTYTHRVDYRPNVFDVNQSIRMFHQFYYQEQIKSVDQTRQMQQVVRPFRVGLAELGFRHIQMNEVQPRQETSVVYVMDILKKENDYFTLDEVETTCSEYINESFIQLEDSFVDTK